jgi:hypothetical protein
VGRLIGSITIEAALVSGIMVWMAMISFLPSYNFQDVPKKSLVVTSLPHRRSREQAGYKAWILYIDEVAFDVADHGVAAEIALDGSTAGSSPAV